MLERESFNERFYEKEFNRYIPVCGIDCYYDLNFHFLKFNEFSNFLILLNTIINYLVGVGVKVVVRVGVGVKFFVGVGVDDDNSCPEDNFLSTNTKFCGQF